MVPGYFVNLCIYQSVYKKYTAVWIIYDVPSVDEKNYVKFVYDVPGVDEEKYVKILEFDDQLKIIKRYHKDDFRNEWCRCVNMWLLHLLCDNMNK